MNIGNLIIGILLIILTSIYLIKTLNKLIDLDEKEDASSRAFNIPVNTSALIFLIVGIVTVYRELKHLF